MLKTIFFYSFLYTCFIGFTQENHNFMGTIQLSDKSLITYKIDFTIDSNNKILGKSTTDFDGGHRTESKIEGSISKDSETISFIETKNLSTKSNYASEDFCYIHLKNAKIKLRNNKSIIQGHFYGKFTDNELCAEGDIYLISEDFMFKKLKQLEKKLPEKHKDKINVPETKKSIEMTILKENDELKVLSSSNSVKLNIWDGEKEDGDLITVTVNGKKILDKFEISNTAKSIVIPIDSSDALIEIFAENEGELPPNSARFSLTDYTQEIQVETQLNKGKKAKIRITKN